MILKCTNIFLIKVEKYKIAINKILKYSLKKKEYITCNHLKMMTIVLKMVF